MKNQKIQSLVETSLFFVGFLMLVFVLGLFQNCSKVAIKNKTDDKVVDDTLGVCGNKVNNNGVCEDFACLGAQDLTGTAVNGVYTIPARTGSGVCYYLKVASAIANGSSALTSVVDSEITSANHDSGAANHNPYQLAASKIKFINMGARTVKLSGSSASPTKILVDNFVMAGISPVTVNQPDPATYYRAYGTSDAGVIVGGTHSNYVMMNNAQVPLTPFASGGTATVQALDITTQVSTGVTYNLDVRAEDCGGARELSDIYLLFQ